jgi:hypothetical protein
LAVASERGSLCHQAPPTKHRKRPLPGEEEHAEDRRLSNGERTVNEQNDLLACLFGLQEVKKRENAAEHETALTLSTLRHAR